LDPNQNIKLEFSTMYLVLLILTLVLTSFQ
jgi:hypothetical protein